METVESMERLVKKKQFRSFQFTLNNFRWCTKNFQENFICASLTSHRFLNEFPVNNFPGYRPRGLHFQQVHVARSYIWENKIPLTNRLRCLRKFCENFSKNAFPARIFCRFLEQMLFLPSTSSKRRKKNVVDNRYCEKKKVHKLQTDVGGRRFVNFFLRSTEKKLLPFSLFNFSKSWSPFVNNLKLIST